MVQMLLPDFGMGVLIGFVYFILGMIFIQCNWRAPKSRGETKLKVSQSQVAESKLGSTLPASNSRKG
jgi:hypothetical protein